MWEDNIREYPVERVQVTNDVGVLYDAELYFKFHTDDIIAEAFRKSGFIMR